MVGTPMRNFLLSLEWLNPLLIWILRQKSISLIQILKLEDMALICILRHEDTPLIWTTPSFGSLNKNKEEGSF